MAKQFPTLDPNALGAGLVLQNGNMVLTTLTHDLDIHRAAHATIAQPLGDWLYECYVYSTSRVSLAGRCRIGISQPNGRLDKAVGEESVSFGLSPGDGIVYNNNAAAVSSIPLIAEQLCMGVFLHLSVPGSESCFWLVEGNQVAVVSLPANKFWLPAFSLALGAAGDIAISTNYGLRAFEHQPSPIV